jgi:diguanylate cyclase (GGDEF)-like protein
MDAQVTIPVIIMIASAAIAALVAIYTWRWRNSPGVFCFILMMAAVSIYAITDAFEVMASTLPAKITWSKLSYLGVVSVSPLWLMFTLRFSQRASWLTRRWTAALWFIPLVTLGLAFTNEWHKLIWPTVQFVSPASGSRAIYGHGVGFWIHITYAYLLMFLGTFVLIRMAWNFSPLYRRQVRLLVIAAIIPWVGNLLYITGLNPWPGLELTPIGFMLTGVLIAAGISRYHTFDIAPVAREVLFNSLGDGVLVLDQQNRLVDINPVARNWTGLTQEAIGRSIFDVLNLSEAARQYERVAEVQTLLEIGEGADQRVFNMKISPLRDARGQVQGRVALLHDIRHERTLLKAELRRSRQMELLNAITRTALSTPDLPQMLQVLADSLGELFDADAAYLTLWDEEQQRAIPTAAYGAMRADYPSTKLEPGEKTMTESVLTAGHVLVVDDAAHSPYLSPRIAALFPTTSMLALPLIVNDQKLGAILVSFNQPHEFIAEEINLGEQAAGLVAISIAKAKLYDAESQRSTQLTALQSISQMVVSSLDLDKIFATVVNVLHDTFKYPYVSIYRLHGETLRLGAEVGYPPELVYHEIPINLGVMGRTIRTRQPQFVLDISTDPNFLRAAYDVQSEICVPLLQEQTVLGVLNIESSPPHILTEVDLQLLITFASQVVVAINNASLFQAEHEQRQLADALRIMGMTLGESLDLEAVLGRLLDEIGKVVPYDSAGVLLMSEDFKEAHLARMRNIERPGVTINWRTTPREFLIATTANLSRMIETGKPLIIEDTENDPDWRDVQTTARLRSWAGAPVSLRGQVSGFLSLDKAEPYFYRPEHAERLAAFTGQAAIAIDNARIFTEMQRRVERERLLFTATRDFTAGLDTEAVLQAIADHMVHGLGVDGCTVSRWDKERDCVVTLLDYTTSQEYPTDIPGKSYALADYPITRDVLENREPRFLSLNDPSIDPSERALMEMYGNRAVLILPLVVGRERQVFGIVELFRRDEAIAFNSDDLELAQSFAAQAAVAIENARLYAETQRLAILDDLTGLYNRRGLFELGQREFERATRFKHPLAALFLDIDHFKLFNDRYSYAVGDQVLVLFANCVRANLRNFDLIGRYGGEEFVVLLPEADLPSAREVAERVRHSVEILQVKTELGETNITVSIGVYLKTADIPDLEALVDRAGQAVHEAKNLGRNRVFVAT